MATSARLLQMLTLLQARSTWAGAELAERLGITTRSVRRDAERLRELGYPVESVSGPGGGYRLGSGRALPPLLLDDNEAVAVVLSLRTSAAQGSVADISELCLSALGKLEQVLPTRLRARVNDLQASTVAIGGGETPVPADLLVLLARASQLPERVTFDYRRHDGTSGRRRVEPHRLVHTGRRWYLVARDVGAGEWRTFRADRISEAVPTGHRFTPQDPPEAATFVSEAVASSPYRWQAEAIVQAAYDELITRVPATVATVVEIDAGSCRIRSGSDSLVSLAAHLSMLGWEFTIVSPPELIEAAATMAGRLDRAIGAAR
jgi:predicted DNA-binding transcriptional regulator YafY